jgi:hypothetical protein
VWCKSRRSKMELRAVPWLRRLVVGLSPRRPGFAPGSIHVGFVVDKLVLGQVFLRVLRFSPVNISFHRRSPNSYHLGDEQYVHQWQQFRDVVSYHNNQPIKIELKVTSLYFHWGVSGNSCVGYVKSYQVSPPPKHHIVVVHRGERKKLDAFYRVSETSLCTFSQYQWSVGSHHYLY